MIEVATDAGGGSSRARKPSMNAAHVGQWALGTRNTVWWSDGGEMISRVDIEGEATMQRTVNPGGVGRVYGEQCGHSGARPDRYWAHEDGAGSFHGDRNFSSLHAMHGVEWANGRPAQVAHAAM